MWTSKPYEQRQPSTYLRRTSSYIDKQFQLKYSNRTFWLVLFSSILVCGPALYLLNQNYAILRNLFHDSAPTLLRHLDREQFSLNLLMFTVLFANLVFVWIFAKRMTAKIVGPLKKLRNHLRLLSRGDYSAPPLHVRDDDEFQDLVQNFNYFYSGIQSQMNQDLERLITIRKLSKHPMVADQLEKMISEKSLQLNLPISTSEESAKSDDSHLAS